MKRYDVANIVYLQQYLPQQSSKFENNKDK